VCAIDAAPRLDGRGLSPGASAARRRAMASQMLRRSIRGMSRPSRSGRPMGVAPNPEADATAPKSRCVNERRMAHLTVASVTTVPTAAVISAATSNPLLRRTRPRSGAQI
jgi:hypothetical protein